MTIHKEGFKIIFIFCALLLSICVVVNVFAPIQTIFHYFLYACALAFWFFIIRFFRVPDRRFLIDNEQVLCPADGTVVAVEEVENSEYFNDRRKQVSIFMSINNVHVNLYPVSGTVKYCRYFPGKFLIAHNPKASLENERTTVVIEDIKSRPVLLRQIAGALARRIVCYAETGKEVKQTGQLGFIKFGSRVDLLLPTDAQIKVTINQKVKAGMTVIAKY